MHEFCYDRKIQVTIYNKFFKQIEYSFEKFLQSYLLHYNTLS